MRLNIPGYGRGGCVKAYYEDSLCTIYHGDCSEVLPTLPTVDLVLTDPPWGVGLIGKKTKHRTRKHTYSIFDDSGENWQAEILPRIKSIISRYTRVIVTPGNKQLFKYPLPSDIGCIYYPAGAGLGAWGFNCWQPVLYYGKDPHIKKGASPASRSFIAPAGDSAHPCPKPLVVMKWLVDKGSMLSETVLDPFMGSGTTLRAAKDLGRYSIGIEICEAYCEIAAKRLAQETIFSVGVGA